MTEEINILGKDYLTEREAAHYAGCSLSQWHKKKNSINLSSFQFLGKTMYRKHDLTSVNGASMATITWRGKNNETARLDWYQRGERRRISLGKVTPEQAETLRLEKELELRTGASSQLSSPGFQEFAKAYLKWHKHEYPASHNRIDQITNDYLIPHLSDTPLDEISPLQLETYKQDRRTSAKTETINKELRTLNAVLNKAIEWQAIIANPITKLPTLKVTDSKPPRYYTKDELDQIYAAAPYNWYQCCPVNFHSKAIC